MGFPHGETITVLSAATVLDGYGDVSLNWGDTDALVVPGCGVADGGSLEPTLPGRSLVESDFDVIVPYGTPVAPMDRVVVRGLTCDVVARPFDWMNPFTGWQPGKVVRVKIAEG